MAIYSIATLKSKGFTEADLQSFKDAELMRDAEGQLSKDTRHGNRRMYVRGEMLQSLKIPSRWPEWAKAIWDTHKTY